MWKIKTINKNKNKNSLKTIGIDIVSYLLILIIVVPLTSITLNKFFLCVYKTNISSNDFIKHITSIITIGVTLFGALIVSERYLSERKSRVITESRIDWLYKMKEYAIKTDNAINKYIPELFTTI